MRCPKCTEELKDEELEANFNRYQDKRVNYVEVEFTCPQGHSYFVRIKEDDLIEAP